jgi:hypothetical protein
MPLALNGYSSGRKIALSLTGIARRANNLSLGRPPAVCPKQRTVCYAVRTVPLGAATRSQALDERLAA